MSINRFVPGCCCGSEGGPGIDYWLWANTCCGDSAVTFHITGPGLALSRGAVLPMNVGAAPWTFWAFDTEPVRLINAGTYRVEARSSSEECVVDATEFYYDGETTITGGHGLQLGPRQGLICNACFWNPISSRLRLTCGVGTCLLTAVSAFPWGAMFRGEMHTESNSPCNPQTTINWVVHLSCTDYVDASQTPRVNWGAVGTFGLLGIYGGADFAPVLIYPSGGSNTDPALFDGGINGLFASAPEQLGRQSIAEAATGPPSNSFICEGDPPEAEQGGGGPFQPMYFPDCGPYESPGPSYPGAWKFGGVCAWLSQIGPIRITEDFGGDDDGDGGLGAVQIGPKPRPDGEPPLPGMGAMAVNYLKSTARHALGGFKSAPVSLQARRLSICEHCEHLRPSDRRCGLVGGCGCGCPVNEKAQRLHEDCPAGRWPRPTDLIES
jgi:hypothetical protein